MLKLLIQNGNNIYQPVVEGDVVWETERKGMPGKLTFKVIPDENLNFVEGNLVLFQSDDKGIFKGFVFTKKRNRDGIISVTAYDQLRYFKNKDTYIYSNKKANELVRMIGNDFNLNVGTLEDTEYIIATRIEENKTLFDIAQTALDLTLQNKNKMFVLYDDYGSLTLKNIESMKLDLMITDKTAEDFDYASSIDENTFNRIKLAYANNKTGKLEVYIAQDQDNINDWGVLQHYEKINETTNAKAKADAMLSLLNKKTRSLGIKNAFGDIRVRGGSGIIVYLSLGDVLIQNYMLVEKVKHRFSGDEHLMDLTVRGGLI